MGLSAAIHQRKRTQEIISVAVSFDIQFQCLYYLLIMKSIENGKKSIDRVERGILKFKKLGVFYVCIRLLKTIIEWFGCIKLKVKL
jgi:hypothetical protein